MDNGKSKRNSNRSTNNPYLTAPNPPEELRATLGSEFSRLCGLPFRLPLTVGLVVLPLLLALAGGVDLLTTGIYTLSHHSASDPRPVVSALDCLGDQAKQLCRGTIWASPASPKRMVLYPWHKVPFLLQFEPQLFIAFFALAIISFALIGSPNAKKVVQTFLAVVGFMSGSKQTATTTASQELGLEVKEKADKKTKGKGKKDQGRRNGDALVNEEENPAKPLGLIPTLEIDTTDPAKLAEAWQSSLILGGYLPRMWKSDPGYFYLDGEVRPAPYWLTLNMLRTNLAIVAPQGSGKTYSVFRPLLTFMRRSNSVAFFWDSKGDDFNPAYFDYNFDPERPADSMKLNIFAGQDPAQAGERLAEALIPDLGGDKQYFSNNAKDAMSALTAAHAICFDRNPELVNLLNYLTTPANVKSLHDMVLEKQRGPAHYEEGLRLATLLRRVMQLAENKSTDVLGSLATALSPLVTGSAARVLVTNPEQDAYTIEDLLKKPGLIRLSLPVAKSPRIAPILGRLILAQFTYAVLSPDCNRKIFKLAAVDEARHFITENVANGMAQARSNNAGYVVAFQALTQVRDESLLDTIFAVSGTKIVMTGVGEKDARRFSDTFGQLELPYVNHSQGQSTGNSKNSGTSYSRGQEYEFFGGQSGREARSSRGGSHGRGQTTNQNIGSTTSSRVRPRFFPAEIRELNQFQAVIESSDAQGRRWFAQIIDMRAATVNRLENQVLEQLKRLREANKTRTRQGSQKISNTENSQSSAAAGAGADSSDKKETPSKETSTLKVDSASAITISATATAATEANSTPNSLTDPPLANQIRQTIRFMPVTVTPLQENQGKESQESRPEVEQPPQTEVTVSEGIKPELQQPLAAGTGTGFPPVMPLALPIDSPSINEPEPQSEPELTPAISEHSAVHIAIASALPQHNEEQFIQASFLTPASIVPVGEDRPVTARDKVLEVTKEEKEKEGSPLASANITASGDKTTLGAVTRPEPVKNPQGLL